MTQTERARCLSLMVIVDREARADLSCGEPPLHDGDHRSSTTGVRWPRLEQAWGAPILSEPGTDSSGRAVQRVLALADELDSDAERAYQRSCGHRDEGSEGQYRAYEDAATRIRSAVAGPQRDHGGEGQ